MSVALLLTSAAAAQQPTPPPGATPAEQAQSHYALAMQLLSQGRYREAIREFDQAIKLAPTPVFYCNRSAARIRLKEFNDALGDLKRCRDDFKGDATVLAQIDAKYQAMHVAVKTLAPGARRVSQQVVAAKTRRAMKPPVVKPGRKTSNTPYIFLGLGAASLASGLTLDLLSGDLRESFIKESEGGPGTSREQYNELRKELTQRRNIFFGLTGAGVVLTGVGAVLLLTSGDDDGAKGKKVRVAPVAGPGQAGVQIGVKF